MILFAPSLPLSLSSSDKPPSRTQHAPHLELDPSILARSVLIVEDEAMIAWTLESLLFDMGFKHIIIAASGADAVQQATRTKPGIILSDINLGVGEMDGVAATTAIAAPDVAVVFITAYASADARQRIARDLPGAALLRKPIDELLLRRAVTEVLTRGRAHLVRNGL